MRKQQFGRKAQSEPCGRHAFPFGERCIYRPRLELQNQLKLRHDLNTLRALMCQSLAGHVVMNKALLQIAAAGSYQSKER